MLKFVIGWSTNLCIFLWEPSKYFKLIYKMSTSQFHTSSVFMGTGPNVHQRYCKQIENKYWVKYEVQNDANVKIKGLT